MTDTSSVHNESNKERDKRFFDNLTTLRTRAGLSKTKLAQLAGVGRNLITDLERKKPATTEKVMLVFHAINDEYKHRFKEELDPDKELTHYSRFGHRA